MFVQICFAYMHFESSQPEDGRLFLANKMNVKRCAATVEMHPSILTNRVL